MTAPLDLDALDPGIRDTVRQLNEAGWETTDSGDGVSKPEMGCALAVPNVTIRVEPERLVKEARRLAGWLANRGVVLQPMDECETVPCLQASYDPGDDTAVIFLANVVLPQETL